MVTRNKILSEAVDKCMKELYSFVLPSVSWDDFVKECKEYSKKYKIWEDFRKASIHRKENPEIWNQYQSTFKDWENKSIEECIGPRPFEFYYLPKEIMKDICDCYIYAYRIDSQQELLNTIEILKNYCKEPIVDKYIEGKNGNPGHRGYVHSDNLSLCLMNLITNSNLNLGNNIGTDIINLANKLQDKFFEFLDMAGNFYNWNGDLNSFNTSVYLGASPNSNKRAVIENWKKYRNKDIEINEEQIKKEYYGEDELD